jgi:ankyrin repeat protein
MGNQDDGATALMWAAYNDHAEVVRLLLAHPSVDVNVTDKVRTLVIAGEVDKICLVYTS